jgi:hypothetical protein
VAVLLDVVPAAASRPGNSGGNGLSVVVAKLNQRAALAATGRLGAGRFALSSAGHPAGLNSSAKRDAGSTLGAVSEAETATVLVLAH